MKPIFLIDYDDVVVDTAKSFSKFEFDKHAIPIENQIVPEGMNVWDYLGMTFEEAISDFQEFHRSNYSLDLEPLEDVVYGMAMLSKQYTLFIGTSRSGSAVDGVQEYCEHLVPDLIKGIYGNLKDKIDFAEKIGAVALFDDQHSHLIKKSKTVRKYLFHKSWNSSFNQDSVGAVRVFGWKDLLTKL